MNKNWKARLCNNGSENGIVSNERQGKSASKTHPYNADPRNPGFRPQLATQSPAPANDRTCFIRCKCMNFLAYANAYHICGLFNYSGPWITEQQRQMNTSRNPFGQDQSELKALFN